MTNDNRKPNAALIIGDGPRPTRLFVAARLEDAPAWLELLQRMLAALDKQEKQEKNEEAARWRREA